MPCVSRCKQEAKSLLRNKTEASLSLSLSPSPCLSLFPSLSWERQREREEVLSTHTGNSWRQEVLPQGGNFPSAGQNTLTITSLMQMHTVKQVYTSIANESHKHTDGKRCKDQMKSYEESTPTIPAEHYKKILQLSHTNLSKHCFHYMYLYFPHSGYLVFYSFCLVSWSSLHLLISLYIYSL